MNEDKEKLVNAIDITLRSLVWEWRKHRSWRVAHNIKAIYAERCAIEKTDLLYILKRPDLEPNRFSENYYLDNALYLEIFG